MDYPPDPATAFIETSNRFKDTLNSFNKLV